MLQTRGCASCLRDCPSAKQIMRMVSMPAVDKPHGPGRENIAVFAAHPAQLLPVGEPMSGTNSR